VADVPEPKIFTDPNKYAWLPPTPAKKKPISRQDYDTLMALWRRFLPEANQLIGHMDQIGIASEAVKEFRKYVHLIRADVLSAIIASDKL